MPTPEQIQDVQQGYDEMLQRGLFQTHPELQQLGHELRARGLVKDPTQGGLLQPHQPPPQTGTPSSGVPVLPDVRGMNPPPGGSIQSPQAAQAWSGYVQQHGLGDPSAPGYAPPGTVVQENASPPAALKLVPHHEPPPAARPTAAAPTVAAPAIGGVLPEEKELHRANLEYNALPPALRSQTYTRAEYGPVSDVGLERTWALSRYAQKADVINQALTREKGSLDALGKQLEQRGGTPQEIAAYKQRAVAYATRANAFRRNYAEWWELKHPGPSLTSEDRQAKVFKLNNTLRFSEENGHDPERVMSFGPLESVVPGAAMRAAMRQIPATRGELLLAGLAPKPLVNPGRNPVERQQYTQQLADLRNKFQDYSEKTTQAVQSVTAGQGPTTRGKADIVRIRRETEQHLIQSLTPWQRSIYPQFKQHVAFEGLAADRAGVSSAFASETTAFAVIGMLAPALAPRAEALVGRPLTALLGKVLAKAGIEEQLARFGGRKLLDLAPAALKRYAIQRAPTAASHAAVGAVLGPASTAAAGAVSGQRPQEIALGAVQSIPEMAAFGGLMSLLAPTIPPEHPAVKAVPGEPVLPPNRMVVDGQPLHLRTAPPVELEQMRINLAQRQQSGQAGHPEAVAEAALGAHLERHGDYAEKQGITFATLQEQHRYLTAWGNMKDPQRAQYELLGREADRLRETSPDLAGKLDIAKIQAQHDFNQRWRAREEARGLRDRKSTSVEGPAQASLWRHLTEEEKAQLSKPAQRDLLLQDLSNSRQVLKLGSLPEREVGERSLERLQTEADRLYQQAEEAYHREIAATAHEAAGLEPVEASPAPPPAAEAAPAPVETPPVPAAVPTSVEAPTPVEAPVPPAEKETASLAVPPEVNQIDPGATNVLAEGAKKAMLEAGVPENRIKWNKAEERYVITGKISKPLEKKLALAREIYENSTYAYTSPEGTTHHIKGLAISHGTEPIETESVTGGVDATPAEQPTGAAALPARAAGPTELGAPGPEPSVPVVAARSLRSRKAGGSAEPTVSPAAGGGTAANPPEVRQPTAGGESAPSRYQPGTILKKSATGLVLRTDERLPDGRWKATVIEPGSLGFKKGQRIGPIGEDTLKDFKPTKQQGVLGTLKQQLKSEEGAFAPPTPPPPPPKHVPGWGDPDDFFNPKAQDAFNRNREQRPPTFWQSVGKSVDEAVTNTWNALTRANQHLPGGARYAEVNSFIDQRKGSVATSRLRAEMQLKQALNGFSPEELQMFDSAWFSLAAKEDLSRQQAAHLAAGKPFSAFKPTPPEGFTVKDVEDGFNKTMRLMQGTDRVSRAVAMMHDLQNDIWKEWATAYERTTGRKPTSDIYFYFRHIVLAYDKNGDFTGPGKALIKRPDFSLRRDWSPLAYSTHFVKAAMEWMPHALRETINLNLLHHVDEDHNIAPGVAFERIQKQPLAHGYLLTLARNKGGALLHMPDGFHQLGELASKDMLPDTGNHQFRPTIDAVQFHWHMNEERAQQGQVPLPPSMTLHQHLETYAEWLLKKAQTRLPLQANQIPKGYVAYPAEKLMRLFPAYAIPNALGEQAMLQTAGQILGVPVERVRKTLTVGRSAQPWVIPEELAKTLDNMGLRRPDNFETQAKNVLQKTQQSWKWWTLFNVAHLPAYLRKTVMLHGGPILRKIPTAMERVPWATGEIESIRRDRIMPTNKDVKWWMDRGGMTATQSQFEGMRAGDVGRFETPPTDPLVKLGLKAAAVARWPHDWRERALRLSVFKETLEDMRKDPHGAPKDFLASNPQEVMALPTLEERAYRLSQDINIPYERTSEAGKLVGANVSPFWSVQEHIFRREGQFLRNAWDKPAINYALGRKIASVLGQPSIGLSRAIDIGKFAAKLGATAFAFEGINYLFHPEAEDKMSPRERWIPHITVGYDEKNDTALTIPIFSNLFEAGRWFGLDHYPEYWDDYVNGRKTVKEIFTDLAMNPINEFYKTMGPQWKIPMELIPGLRRFPDFRHPIPMHDRGEEAFRMLGLEGLYHMIYQVPQRPQGMLDRTRDFLLGTKMVNLGESAYNSTRERVDRFLESKGLPRHGVTLGDDPRSLLLYRYRQAIRLGDTTGAYQYLFKGAFDKNIGLTGKNYVQAIKNAEPLHALNPLHHPKMFKEFIDSLPAADRLDVENAYRHWQHIYAPQADLKLLKVGNTFNLINTMRDAVVSDAHMHNPLQTLRTAPETRKEIQVVQHEKALLKR